MDHRCTTKVILLLFLLAAISAKIAISNADSTDTDIDEAVEQGPQGATLEGAQPIQFDYENETIKCESGEETIRDCIEVDVCETKPGTVNANLTCIDTNSICCEIEDAEASGRRHFRSHEQPQYEGGRYGRNYQYKGPKPAYDTRAPGYDGYNGPGPGYDGPAPEYEVPIPAYDGPYPGYDGSRPEYIVPDIGIDIEKLPKEITGYDETGAPYSDVHKAVNYGIQYLGERDTLEKELLNKGLYVKPGTTEALYSEYLNSDDKALQAERRSFVIFQAIKYLAYKAGDESKYYVPDKKGAGDSKYESSKYEGGRYEGPKYEGDKYGAKYEGAKYEGDKYEGDIYKGGEYKGAEYENDKYAGTKYGGEEPYVSGTYSKALYDSVSSGKYGKEYPDQYGKGCRATKYRSIDGHCNNLKHPEWGRAFRVYNRLLPANYADGISAPRKAKDNSYLPSARLLSSQICTDKSYPVYSLSLMAMQWGQFVDHDISFSSVYKARGSHGILCCAKEMQYNRHLLHPECYPIIIPKNDYFYSRHGTGCMEFVRSLAGTSDEQTYNSGKRQQLNQVSSFIDGSIIYGTTLEEANSLRTFKYGTLITVKRRGFDYLPVETNRRCTDPSLCYRVVAGDSRANMHPWLTVLHILFVREHNRIAYRLYEINPDWDDEYLYQEARRIVGAILQHITYNELLPTFLGYDILEKYGLTLKKYGYSNDYNDYLNPTTLNEFSAAAFRVGHSLIYGLIEFRSREYGNGKLGPLRDHFFDPLELFDEGELDKYILSLMTQPQERADTHVTQEVTNYLFKTKNTTHGLDLISLNIQRGRDHGLPSYNEYRKLCGYKKAYSFDDLYPSIDRDVIAKLKYLYKTVDDIDLFIGGIAEKHNRYSQIGPTLSCIIANQFRRVKIGDRHWYELGGQPSSFSHDQLKELRKVTLARIICSNSDKIKYVQRWVFRSPSDGNYQVACNYRNILDIDLTKWKSTYQKGAAGYDATVYGKGGETYAGKAGYDETVYEKGDEAYAGKKDYVPEYKEPETYGGEAYAGKTGYGTEVEGAETYGGKSDYGTDSSDAYESGAGYDIKVAAGGDDVYEAGGDEVAAVETYEPDAGSYGEIAASLDVDEGGDAYDKTVEIAAGGAAYDTGYDVGESVAGVGDSSTVDGYPESADGETYESSYDQKKYGASAGGTAYDSAYEIDAKKTDYDKQSYGGEDAYGGDKSYGGESQGLGGAAYDTATTSIGGAAYDTAYEGDATADVDLGISGYDTANIGLTSGLDVGYEEGYESAKAAVSEASYDSASKASSKHDAVKASAYDSEAKAYDAASSSYGAAKDSYDDKVAAKKHDEADSYDKLAVYGERSYGAKKKYYESRYGAKKGYEDSVYESDTYSKYGAKSDHKEYDAAADKKASTYDASAYGAKSYTDSASKITDDAYKSSEHDDKYKAAYKDSYDSKDSYKASEKYEKPPTYERPPTYDYKKVDVGSRYSGYDSGPKYGAAGYDDSYGPDQRYARSHDVDPSTGDLDDSTSDSNETYVDDIKHDEFREYEMNATIKEENPDEDARPERAYDEPSYAAANKYASKSSYDSAYKASKDHDKAKSSYSDSDVKYYDKEADKYDTRTGSYDAAASAKKYSEADFYDKDVTYSDKKYGAKKKYYESQYGANKGYEDEVYSSDKYAKKHAASDHAEYDAAADKSSASYDASAYAARSKADDYDKKTDSSSYDKEHDDYYKARKDSSYEKAESSAAEKESKPVYKAPYYDSTYDGPYDRYPRSHDNANETESEVSVIEEEISDQHEFDRPAVAQINSSDVTVEQESPSTKEDVAGSTEETNDDRAERSYGYEEPSSYSAATASAAKASYASADKSSADYDKTKSSYSESDVKYYDKEADKYDTKKAAHDAAAYAKKYFESDYYDKDVAYSDKKYGARKKYYASNYGAKKGYADEVYSSDKYAKKHAASDHAEYDAAADKSSSSYDASAYGTRYKEDDYEKKTDSSSYGKEHDDYYKASEDSSYKKAESSAAEKESKPTYTAAAAPASYDGYKGAKYSGPIYRNPEYGRPSYGGGPKYEGPAGYGKSGAAYKSGGGYNQRYPRSDDDQEGSNDTISEATNGTSEDTGTSEGIDADDDGSGETTVVHIGQLQHVRNNYNADKQGRPKLHVSGDDQERIDSKKSDSSYYDREHDDRYKASERGGNIYRQRQSTPTYTGAPMRYGRFGHHRRPPPPSTYHLRPMTNVHSWPANDDRRA